MHGGEPAGTALYTTRAVRPIVPFALAILVLAPPAGLAQPDAGRVDALIRGLKGRDFDRASAADTELRKHTTRDRARVVAGLIDALRVGEWNRCSGDMRDSIARTLAELKVKAAVVPLLDLVKTGKSIEHECAE